MLWLRLSLWKIHFPSCVVAENILRSASSSVLIISTTAVTFGPCSTSNSDDFHFEYSELSSCRFHFRSSVSDFNFRFSNSDHQFHFHSTNTQVEVPIRCCLHSHGGHSVLASFRSCGRHRLGADITWWHPFRLRVERPRASRRSDPNQRQRTPVRDLAPHP